MVSETVKNAIASGVSRAEKSRSVRSKKFYSSPASLNKLVMVFNRAFREHGFGVPLPLSKKTMGMLNGFIKLGRNNDWEDEYFYKIVREVVESWPELRKKELTSLNGKRILLSARPNLNEFLISRDSMLSYMEEIKTQKEVVLKRDLAISLTSHSPSTEEEQSPEDSYLRGPTEEDMEEENQRMLDNL